MESELRVYGDSMRRQAVAAETQSQAYIEMTKATVESMGRQAVASERGAQALEDFARSVRTMLELFEKASKEY